MDNIEEIPGLAEYLPDYKTITRKAIIRPPKGYKNNG